MQKIKYEIISFWLRHIFLRHIGKRYPDFFKRWMADLTDSETKRKIMALRYSGDKPMGFEAIAITIGISPRRVFEHHKTVIDKIIYG